MKNGKILFIATLLLVSLLCISAVSAADDAASDVIADNNDETILDVGIDDADLGDSESDELSQSDENVVGDGETPPPINPSFTLLSDKIVNNDEVILEDDYSYTYYDDNFQKGININHNVTIKGNGHKIDGQKTARIFYIGNNVTVILEDINFVNANSSFGGAIYCLRDSHKGIIIGKNGEMLKKIGTYARQDLERMLQTKINLKIWVKVNKNWQQIDKINPKYWYACNNSIYK